MFSELATALEAPVDRPPELSLQQFEYCGQSVRALCCESFRGCILSADVDLTGFMIWPASHVMCHYIASRPEVFRGKNCLELGAGCGICGFLASRVCKTTIISDGSLRALQLAKQGGEPESEALQFRELLWAHEPHIKALLVAIPEGFNLVLGADIAYPGEASEARLRALFSTARDLLTHDDPDASFVCAYVSRNRGTDQMLGNIAVEYGFTWTVVKPGDFGAPTYGIYGDACIIHFKRGKNDQWPCERPLWQPPPVIVGRQSSSPDPFVVPGDDFFDDD
eukprot:TRINITY_DN15131_c0_g1_i1.p1 TRINITY_DN15131_c0_g1~~TRINITY_DN15131_c0_g1_i1.p1  ORF type:complete len:280 (-),score=35.44 TRINITY_DN15131_c0_g1_i1:295-1134(-)